MRRALAGWSVISVGVAMVFAPRIAGAEPGMHSSAVSVWDTRAHSVVLGGRTGGHERGHLTDVGMWTNFTSTQGVLSAQFGAHYVDLGEGSRRFYGVSGSAAALAIWPLMRRYDNGVPRVGFALFGGSAPTALIGGQVNYFTAPLVLGLGMPLSPAAWVTLTPWGELAPSLNLDTAFDPLTLRAIDYVEYLDPETGTVRFDSGTAAQLFQDTVSLELGFGLSARGGLALDLHLNERVSFSLTGGVGTLGQWEDSQLVFSAGGAMVWRWDRIVPAVLTAERRLAGEDCAAVAERHRLCLAEGSGAAAGPPPAPSPPPRAPSPTATSPLPRAPVPAKGTPAAGPSETAPYRPASSGVRPAPSFPPAPTSASPAPAVSPTPGAEPVPAAEPAPDVDPAPEGGPAPGAEPAPDVDPAPTPTGDVGVGRFEDR